MSKFPAPVSWLPVYLGFSSLQNTRIPCTIGCLLCCFFNFSPLMDPFFLCLQVLSFHILKSVRAKQNSKHPHAPPHYSFISLCSNEDQPSSKKGYVFGLYICLHIWSPLSCLSFSPVCGEDMFSLRRNSGSPPCFQSRTFLIWHPLWLFSDYIHVFPSEVATILNFLFIISLFVFTVLHCLVLRLEYFMQMELYYI